MIACGKDMMFYVSLFIVGILKTAFSPISTRKSVQKRIMKNAQISYFSSHKMTKKNISKKRLDPLCIPQNFFSQPRVQNWSERLKISENEENPNFFKEYCSEDSALFISTLAPQPMYLQSYIMQPGNKYFSISVSCSHFINKVLLFFHCTILIFYLKNIHIQAHFYCMLFLRL